MGDVSQLAHGTRILSRRCSRPTDAPAWVPRRPGWCSDRLRPGPPDSVVGTSTGGSRREPSLAAAAGPVRVRVALAGPFHPPRSPGRRRRAGRAEGDLKRRPFRFGRVNVQPSSSSSSSSPTCDGCGRDSSSRSPGPWGRERPSSPSAMSLSVSCRESLCVRVRAWDGAWDGMRMANSTRGLRGMGDGIHERATGRAPLRASAPPPPGAQRP